jgi:predicted O-linked N-acetylglucosamine transferase (SPINDLY family)
MEQVPGSRFLYVRAECASALLRDNLTAEFARHGIGADRLRFVNNKAAALSHFAYYDEIDVSLDTMPLTGGTTTVDALWMGVPVVTLAGPSLHQRISRAVLCKAGLAGLATDTPDAYVSCAVTLAGDTDRLHRLRTTLRQTLLDSPLCRREDFARDFCDVMEQVAVGHGLR